MAGKSISRFSLLLNAILVALLVFAWQSRDSGETDSRVANTGVAKVTSADELEQLIQERAATGNVQQKALEITGTVDWESIDTYDYTQLRENLIAAGLPEQAADDIIVARINREFDERIKRLVQQPGPFLYWKNDTSQFSGGINADAVEMRLALLREKNEVLRSVLGDDFEPPAGNTAAWSFGNRYDYMLDYLAPDKRQAIRELDQQAQLKFMRARSQNGNDNMTAARSWREAQLQKELELAVILTPAEKREYDLRMSRTALQIRGEADDFDFSQAEFEAVFDVRKAYDDQWSLTAYGDNDADRVAQQRQAYETMQIDVRSALGDVRYSEYERSKDHYYRAMRNEARRNGLDESVASAVYDIKKNALDEANAINQNSSLSTQEKMRRRKAIRDDTERQIRSYFGSSFPKDPTRSRAFEWLNQLHHDPLGRGSQ